jgi:hypothetical protein
MVGNQFIQLLNLNLRKKNMTFETPADTTALFLIHKLKDLNVISNITLAYADSQFVTYLLTEILIVNIEINPKFNHRYTKPQIKSYLKKHKSQPYSYNKIKYTCLRRQIIILNTSKGLKTNFECLKLRCSGYPLIEII